MFHPQLAEDLAAIKRSVKPFSSLFAYVETINKDEHALDRALHFDFTITDPWRVLRIMSEFVEGFDALSHIPPSVAIFGSARAGSGSRGSRSPRLPAQAAPNGRTRTRKGNPGLHTRACSPASRAR